MVRTGSPAGPDSPRQTTQDTQSKEVEGFDSSPTQEDTVVAIVDVVKDGDRGIPGVCQTGDDILNDEMYAAKLAKQEADMAMQLTGGQKPSSSSAAQDEFVLGQPSQPQFTTPGGGPSEGAHQMMSNSSLHDPSWPAPDTKILIAKAEISSRSSFVGRLAWVLSALSLLYLFVHVVKWETNSAPSYRNPGWIDILHGFLCLYVTAVGMLGVLATWRKSFGLVSAYVLGLIMATILKGLLAMAMAVSAREDLQKVLEANGCFREQRLSPLDWSLDTCRRYRTEAMVAASFGIFPMSLCILYLFCAMWLRAPMKALLDYETSGARDIQLAPRMSDGTSIPSHQVDLEAGARPAVASHPSVPSNSSSGLGGFFGKKKKFDADKNNRRILQELNKSPHTPEDQKSKPAPAIGSGPSSYGQDSTGKRPLFSSPMGAQSSVMSTPRQPSGLGLNDDDDFEDVVLGEEAKEIPASRQI